MGELGRIFAFLEAQPMPVYLVGGSLRQLLLGLDVKDYDFVVPDHATRLAYKLADHFHLSCFPLDRERDMARVVLPDLVLDFAPYGTDLNQDLRLRDLSLNAMACPVTSRILSAGRDELETQLIDPCGGRQDLRMGLIRGVSRANFEADPLRLLRVYRFAASLDFQVEGETESWVGQLAPLLRQVAAERILAELEQILLKPKAAGWLERMQGLSLLFFLPPDLLLEQLRCYEHLSSQHPADVLSYLKQTMAAQRPRLFVLKLALLLLDPVGSRGQSSLQQLEALTLSRRELDSLLLWQRLISMLQTLLAGMADPIALRFELYRQAQTEILGLLLLAQIWCQLGQLEDNCGWLELLQSEWLDPDNQVAHPRRLLEGKGLMQALQLKPGPVIGRLLLSIQLAQARGLVTSETQALDFARAELERQS
ncbi:MAG TPA: hypothetical protein V6D23_00525 [Candidatus Obscuribacterales bacterium]